MEKKNQLFLVNAVICVLLGAVLILGLMLTTVVPHGGGHGHAQIAGQAPSFLGASREQWADLHKFLAICFVLGAALHVYLNWAWVHSTVEQRFGPRARTFLLSLLGGSVALVILGWITLLVGA